jgi:ABC-2 type transport system ATP-binding protein
VIAAAYALQVFLMLALPVALVAVLRRRWGVRWSLVGVGAATFVASQVVHFPLLNAVDALVKRGVLPAPPAAWTLAVNAAVLGLLAGLCEESARWLALRFWARRARSWRDAVVLGAGHGGTESVLLGGLAALTLFRVVVASRTDLAAAGLPPDQVAAAQAQIAAVLGAPPWIPFVAVAERVMTIFVVHLTCSALVMLGAVRGRLWPVAAAVAWHAFVDGAAVWVMGRFGAFAAEVELAVLIPAAALLLWTVARRLPRETPPADDEEAQSRAGAAAAAARDVAGPAAAAGAAGAAAAPSSEGAVVEAAGVVKSFGAVRALDEVSFTIAPGERACLLGPNGAGKTTMLRLLIGALSPTRGTVRLFGRRAADADFLASKRHVGIVPQSPGMYRDVKAAEYLRLVADLYGRGDVGEVLAALGLADYADRPMAALSGGLQRRLALAAALLPRPDLLLLDEPTVGLDPVAAHEVHEYLRRVMQGRTTILCTHNLAEAEDLCDSVVILRAGRVVLHEPLAALRARTAPQVLLAAGQGRDALVAALARLGHTARAHGAHVVVSVPEAERRTPELLRALLGAGLDVSECRIERPSLEDLFLDVVAAPAAGAPAASAPMTSAPAAAAAPRPDTAAKEDGGAPRS